MNRDYVFRRRYSKALETLVYLARKDQRQYWILKTIYLADKEHLKLYGRQIFDDRYIAMSLGPVPSLAYDIVKSVRADSARFSFPEPMPSTALNAPDNYTVVAQRNREADMDLLSESEIKCLNDAHNMIKDLTIEEVKKLTHDAAYKAADENDEMSIKDVIKTLENSAEILDYMYEE
ncbi:MAG: Panacea domain-containing protein [Anaerolineae bacterium]|nr:Panacea domain-containing protein [Anaerolineae bacterium]